MLLRSTLLFALPLACGTPKPLPPPCDEATLAAITARCSAYAASCAAKGGTEAECTSACDKELDARQERCR